MFYRWLSALCVLWLVECFSKAVISWLSPVSFSPRWWIRELAFISHCWPDKDLVLIAGWKSRFVKHGWFTEADNSSTGQQWSPEGWGREIDRGKKGLKKHVNIDPLFTPENRRMTNSTSIGNLWIPHTHMSKCTHTCAQTKQGNL